MGQLSNEEIYRVRAAGDHWLVYRGTACEPLASFADKASALACALHLAHTHADPVEYASNVTGRQFGAIRAVEPDRQGVSARSLTQDHQH